FNKRRGRTPGPENQDISHHSSPSNSSSCFMSSFSDSAFFCSNCWSASILFSTRNSLPMTITSSNPDTTNSNRAACHCFPVAFRKAKSAKTAVTPIGMIASVPSGKIVKTMLTSAKNTPMPINIFLPMPNKLDARSGFQCQLANADGNAEFDQRRHFCSIGSKPNEVFVFAFERIGFGRNRYFIAWLQPEISCRNTFFSHVFHYDRNFLLIEHDGERN